MARFASADALTKLGPTAKTGRGPAHVGDRHQVHRLDDPQSLPRGVRGPARHVLTLGTKYRPFDGKVGVSRAWHCYNTGDHSVWGGWSWIDTEYWSKPDWFSSNKITNAARLKNAIPVPPAAPRNSGQRADGEMPARGHPAPAQSNAPDDDSAARDAAVAPALAGAGPAAAECEGNSISHTRSSRTPNILKDPA